MPTIDLAPPPDGANLQQLQDYMTRMMRNLNYLINSGRLDSANAQEFGGWFINTNQMASKDNDVGMSTIDTAGDDIRFWAGDVITGTPAFYVTKSGKLFAYDGTFVGTITADSGTIGGWTITSTSITSSNTTYPRTVLNASGNIQVMYSATEYVVLTPTLGGEPSIAFIGAAINSAISHFTLGTPFFTMQTDGDILLYAPSGTIQLSSSSGGFTDTVAEINSKASAGANSDITSLSGLTTDLSVSQGGTGASSLTGALIGNGTSAISALTGVNGTFYVSDTLAGANTRRLVFTSGILTGSST